MLLLSHLALGADVPKVQMFDEVEKGFVLGLQGGASYNLNQPPPGDVTAGPALLTGLEIGYDILWVLRLKGGFLIDHYSATAESNSGRVITMDYQNRLAWAGLSFALLATKRFYAYLQAGGGYLFTSPKKVGEVVIAKEDSGAVMGGGGLEYYPHLRHFSFAIEANFTYLIPRGDMIISIFPVIRYTFGTNRVNVVKPPQDRDGDGVPDSEDECPDQFGSPTNKGCPETDTDGDGLVDREDRCPNEPGPAANFGCPSDMDTDKDGLPDKIDRCPKEPGPKENEGCPDRDGDGVYDYIDKCPDTPGEKKFDGCPNQSHIKVTVTARAIELHEKVYFDFGKASIQRRSNPLLDQVAATLKQYPEIKKLRVEGHTDNKGSREYNQDLSQRRAQSVVDYLIGKGIESERLIAKGFGMEKPITSNKSEESRSKNRRVEMIILERDK